MEDNDILENMAFNAAYEDESINDTRSHDPTVRLLQEQLDCSYERALELTKAMTTAKTHPTEKRQAVLSQAQARKLFAVKLDGPLSTPGKVQIAANLHLLPRVYHGSGEEGSVTFCKVDGRAKVNIETWFLKQTETNFRPLFVPDGTAYKELCPNSIYPTLGKDVTLPQYRPQDPYLLIRSATFGRSQDQYPVWYFFYGTLASAPKLRSLFELSDEVEDPVLLDAMIKGGKLATWGNGKYNALLDGLEMSFVKGLAYLVKSEEHENVLRKYETNAYEVVRCSIEMEGRIVEGCTFRFVDKVD